MTRVPIEVIPAESSTLGLGGGCASKCTLSTASGIPLHLTGEVLFETCLFACREICSVLGSSLAICPASVAYQIGNTHLSSRVKFWG